jgi:hypothetical protein
MKVNFTEYEQILRAERVSIYDLLKHFKKEDMDYDEWGNVYINFSKETKGTPIMVAHTDNVLRGERKPVLTLDGKRIFGGNGVGIGFDDKTGIICAIEIWKRMHKKGMRIIFTADEEIGGVGARHVPETKLEDAAYIIEMDRRGGNDVIDVSGATRLASDEFVKIWEDLGFKTATGTFTDLNEFKDVAPKVNMVNISCGYYKPHTNDEYLEIAEFEHNVDRIFEMISTHPDVIVDDTPEEPKKYDRYGTYSGCYGNQYDWEDKLDRYYNTVDECAYCGAIVRPHEGVEDADGNVFCDEKCQHWYEQMVNNEDQSYGDDGEDKTKE